jgi:MtN3 and saliva related transmembrane protein
MSDVSLTMPILLSLGMSLWFVYGVILNDLPIMIWNLIALGLNITVIFLILSYRRGGAPDTETALSTEKE